ncbi:hypothetical protein [Bacillus multifaciens]|uniref:UPF0738 family protein n=1 Tax=Bacillus multifaciens TaxID=3068506 RepID=UPI0027414EDB|nr:hypothetical protein [Bacillus sp. WLY-B-L8]MDP7977596.1 hypothetical protein [Bacillus sp. WLY-B-L8]HDX9588301.1 hypothetical protein [Bacillus pseudomycoides]
MQNKIQVKSVENRENALIFCAENTELCVDGLKARSHVLVDSDNLSFLYILENETDFIYVSIPHTYWVEVKEAMKSDKTMHVRIQDVEIELEQMKEELEYLIGNIEGNANYGEELVNEVERVFL